MADLFGSLAPPLTAQQTLQRNSPYVNPAAGTTYNTPLNTLDEAAFRGWLSANKVPFNPDSATSDYDMRGFYRAFMSGNNPQAQSAVDPNDGRLHYPDYWKTPYHDTFSNQSQWAGPVAPAWTDDDKLVAPNGRVVFDDKAQR